MNIFVDSSFLVALMDKSDIHFKEAEEYLLSQDSGDKLIANNLIIAETMTRLRFRAGFHWAKEFGEKFRNSNLIQMIWVDKNIEAEAWKIFLKYCDKEFSYVDCYSFACMRLNKMTHALTFDRHFRQAGFITLPNHAS